MTTSATPVELRPGAPRVYAGLLVAAVGVAILALALTGLGVIERVALAVLVVLIGARAWSLQSLWTGAFVRLRRDGTAEWRRPHRDAERRGRWIGHWHAGPLVALVFEFDDGGRRRERIALWRDQVDPEAWRRLLILLRHDRRGDGTIG